MPEARVAWSVVGRYALFQLPELSIVGLALVGAVHFAVLPEAGGWALATAWLVKEVVLFPFVRSAYEPSNPNAAAVMVGKVAVVTQRLDPRGTVRIGPELWAARVEGELPPVDAGERVCVEAVEGLTLRVRPFPG